MFSNKNMTWINRHFNFGVQRTCTIGKCPGIHIMVVLRNTECGVEEHRVQACNEVVWAITRSVHVQSFMTRTYCSSQFRSRRIYPQSGEVTRCCPPRPPSGCRNEERNTPSLVNQPVVIEKNGGISWIANYVIRSHEHN